MLHSEARILNFWVKISIMSNKTQLPFGQWPSQISPQNTGRLLDLSETAWNDKGDLFWRERSSNQSSIQMVDAGSKQVSTVSGSFNVGGSLLYGGGSFGVRGDWILFLDKSSRQLIRTSFSKDNAIKLTTRLEYAASPVISPNQESVLFVHSDGEQDTLYLSHLEGESGPILINNDNDFYNYPRWHPHGKQIAWISWNQPHMPWDSSSLWLGAFEKLPQKNPQLESETLIAGGDGISVLQPEFSPNGKWLAYISDQSGWWQLYLYELVSGEVKQLTRQAAEHALPPWLQNRNAYGFSSDSKKLFFLRNQEGSRSVWVMDLDSEEESKITLESEYTWMDWLSISPQEDRLAMIASAANIPPQVIVVDPTGSVEIIRKSNSEELPRNLFSLPKPVSWPNTEGSPVKGLFYSPHNPAYEADGAPPLLMIIHSGPTRQKFAEFSPRTQFFTSRGFAVLEVNYRGSSGYGRFYRQALKGSWGVADVEDSLEGALYITGQGWADRDRMALLGSSSGGLTVYQILIRYPGIFQAGIILYGIVNHLDLLKDPPKFERHYSDWLIGSYPENEQLYEERSPIFSAEEILDPIAIFQGGRDPIVPRNQADQIIQILKENQIPHLYTIFPDEGHGFKKVNNIEDFYLKSLDFLDHHLIMAKEE